MFALLNRFRTLAMGHTILEVRSIVLDNPGPRQLTICNSCSFIHQHNPISIQLLLGQCFSVEIVPFELHNAMLQQHHWHILENLESAKPGSHSAFLVSDRYYFKWCQMWYTEGSNTTHWRLWLSESYGMNSWVAQSSPQQEVDSVYSTTKYIFHLVVSIWASKALQFKINVGLKWNMC